MITLPVKTDHSFSDLPVVLGVDVTGCFGGWIVRFLSFEIALVGGLLAAKIRKRKPAFSFEFGHAFFGLVYGLHVGQRLRYAVQPVLELFSFFGFLPGL